MDVTIDQLIDVALNMAGFMAGGALMMVLASMFRRRQPHQAAVPAAVKPIDPAPVEKPRPAKTVPTRMQFIKFGETAVSRPTERRSAAVGSKTSTPVRRNREEVIRLAREMIAAKQPKDKIARSLPVSEAELAMLSNEE